MRRKDIDLGERHNSSVPVVDEERSVYDPCLLLTIWRFQNTWIVRILMPSD